MDLDLAVAARSGAAAQGAGAPARGGRTRQPTEADAAQEAARRAGAVPNPTLVLNEDPQRDAARAVGSLHPLDPVERADDHRLVARLLLLRRADDVRAAVRQGSLPRQPGGGRARAGVAGRRLDRRHARRRPGDRRDASPRQPRGPRLGPGCVLHRRGAAADPGVPGEDGWASRVVRRFGAAFLAAANPPIQAARLDIMPAGLWGRAESTRTLIRSLIQALAPLVFGGLAAAVHGFLPHPGADRNPSATALGARGERLRVHVPDPARDAGRCGPVADPGAPDLSL